MHSSVTDLLLYTLKSFRSILVFFVTFKLFLGIMSRLKQLLKSFLKPAERSFSPRTLVSVSEKSDLVSSFQRKTPFAL